MKLFMVTLSIVCFWVLIFLAAPWISYFGIGRYFEWCINKQKEMNRKKLEAAEDRR